MSSIPLGYHTMIKNREGLALNFYRNLLQISVHNRAIIYDLDDVQEVA